MFWREASWTPLLGGCKEMSSGAYGCPYPPHYFGCSSSRVLPFQLVSVSHTWGHDPNMLKPRAFAMIMSVLRPFGFNHKSIIRKVSNATLAKAASVLSSENSKNIRDGGAASKKNPKGLGPTFSLCARAGIDAALVKAQFSFRRRPHRKYNWSKNSNTKVASG